MSVIIGIVGRNYENPLPYEYLFWITPIHEHELAWQANT
jgi:hypothetical protein